MFNCTFMSFEYIIFYTLHSFSHYFYPPIISFFKHPKMEGLPKLPSKHLKSCLFVAHEDQMPIQDVVLWADDQDWLEEEDIEKEGR